MPKFIDKIDNLKREHIKQYPCNSNRASEMGHECLRYLVFMRTKWQEKCLHDLELQYIFEEGNIHEDDVLNSIKKAGFKIIEQQKSFEWREYQITGHIDAKAVEDNCVIPIEIKSASPYTFEKIDGVESLKNAKYHYMRKYPAQMTLYLLMDNKEYGYFIFKNKQTGRLKEVRVDLDYQLGEELLKKAEAINRHVKEGTLPSHMPYDEDICIECGFRQICLPDVKRSALEFINNKEIEEKLDRYFELKPFKKEYDELDKHIKKIFK